MFKNIGQKIKTTAEVFCILGIVVSVWAGIVMVVSGNPGGLFFLIFGPLFSWIGSFFAYGFAQIVEKTEENAENTRRILSYIQAKGSNKGKASDFLKEIGSNGTQPPFYELKCVNCGEKTTRYPCEKCGYTPPPERKMQCPSCGSIQNRENKYCEQCGKEI